MEITFLKGAKIKYTLLDAIKSKSWVRSETGLIEYQSLPKGVKELSYSRFMFFIKDWSIVFEGALELGKLEAICKENGYSLITEEPAKDPPFIMETVRGFDETLDKIGAFLDASKPDRRYSVCKGHEEFVCINWYDHNKKLYFATSQRKGLELAEDYRRSLLNL